MKKRIGEILLIIGGVACAVTSLIPIYKCPDCAYTLLETVLSATGQYLGAGLAVLGGSFISVKYWHILRPISVYLLFFSLVWAYDNHIDLQNNVRTYHYTWCAGALSLITYIICLSIKLRRLSI